VERAARNGGRDHDLDGHSSTSGSRMSVLTRDGEDAATLGGRSDKACDDLT
jgi:hypothetical protein